MGCIRLMMIIAICVAVHGSVSADVPDSQRNEVAHLLEFIRTTNCTVERNGTRHSGEDAYRHVKKKYDYFRDDIRTTEEFIEYSATRSTMSGRPYTAICDGAPPIETRDWLIRELRDFRGQAKS